MQKISTNIPIISAANQKGGAGKTTTVGLLAEWFALIRHKRVLIVDLDMQCNSTDQWIGMELAPEVIGGQLPPPHPDYNPEWQVNERSTIADVFYGIPVLPYVSWLNNQDDEAKGTVEVMCGHPQKLEEVNISFNRTDGQLDQRVHNRLNEFFSDPEIQKSYDLILLDNGPSRNPLFRAAVRACTHIVIPFRPEEKDIQGITSMLQILRQENYSRSNERTKLQLIGLLPNMVRPTKLHEDNLNFLKEEHNAILFPQNAWLSHLTAFPERDVKGSKPKSVFALPENSLARTQATAMAQYVDRAIFEDEL